MKRHILTGDVLLLIPTTPELTVGQEFALARAARKARLEKAREAQVVELAAPVEFPSDGYSERPWPKGCNTCAGLVGRVEGPTCAECGLERRDSA